jgi:hypothetical protein
MAMIGMSPQDRLKTVIPQHYGLFGDLIRVGTVGALVGVGM